MLAQAIREEVDAQTVLRQSGSMKAKATILLLGSNPRAALSVARSLGRAGTKVDILRFSPERTPADLSRYCNRAIFLGQPYFDVKSFAGRLLELLSKERYEVVFPVNDAGNELIYHMIDSIPRETRVVGPSAGSYRKAVDKSFALETALELGFKGSETTLLKTEDLSNAAHLASQACFPLFIKPVYSAVIRDNFLQRFFVRKVNNPREFVAKLHDDLPRVPLLLQAPIGGSGVGVNFCAHEGRIIAATMTERIHEPRNGGGSSYRRNIPLDTLLLERIRALAQKLSWTGLMMVELKRAGNDDYVMEFNCRPWGSIETAIRAGVNFPLLATQVARGQARDDGFVSSNRICYVRNLKMDLGWILKRRREWFGKPMLLRSWFRSWGRALAGQETFDVEQMDDLRPALFQFFGDIGRLFRGVARLVEILYTRLTYRFAPATLDPAAPLLVVCRGNINRSAVAEQFLRSKGFKRVSSAGMIAAHGRAASPEAIAFLHGLGISAEGHRSSCVFSRRSELPSYAHIVVFDFGLLVDFRKAFPEVADRLLLLGQIDRSGTREIRDPHGRSAEEYRRCFEEIIRILGQNYESGVRH
jgi:protein-tyrosine-phosphatase/predicted ATP-grasp superfamily ATP-dependent carboligase